MFRSVIQFLLTGALALSWLLSASQSSGSEIFFDRYGPAQGLHTRQIRTIVQSSDGFIWMATNEGLVRYDGEQFTLFFDQAVPSDISNNRYVESMVIDDQDRIWIANNNQLVVYHTRTNQWKYLSDSNGSTSFFPIRFAYDTTSQRMWVACEHGLCYVDQSLEVIWFSFQDSKYDKLPYNTIALQSDTALWLGNTYGYFRLNPKNGNVEAFHIPDRDTTKNNAEGIFSSYIMGDSILWFGGWGTGLIKHDLATGASYQYYYSNRSTEFNAVYDITYFGTDGSSDILWVGTYKGLMTFNAGTGTFTSYRSEDTYNAEGVTGTIFSLFIGSDNSLWIGGGDGLFRYDPRKQGIEKIIFPQLDSCFSIQQMAFEKNQAGNIRIWFAIPYCGWHIYNLHTKQLEPFPDILQRTLNDVGLFEIYIDRTGKLWLGTNERGMLVYDIARQAFPPYSGKYFTESGSWVFEVFEGPDKIVWLGTYNGLFRFDVTHQHLSEVEPVRKLIDDRLISSGIHFITADAKGNIWATTHFDDERSGSLLCYDTLKHTVRYFDRFNTPSFANVHEFREVVCMKDGTIFLTTDRGLFAIGDGDIRRVKDFPEFNTTLGPSVSSLTVDADYGLWISSAYGVTRLNRENNTIYTYNYTTSMLGRAYIPAIWFDKYTDRIYVAQHGGIDVIKNIPLINQPVRLLCLNFKINQIDMDPQAELLLDLRFDENDLLIRLALPHYSNPGNNLFRVTLEGYDNGWTSTNTGAILYNNLPPGHYTFRAIGITGEGQESSNSIIIPFYIHPPFWKTWWFLGAIMAIVSGLIMVFFLYRESQRKRLQRMRYAIARDLHDDIGSNLSTIKLLSEFELLKNPNVEHSTLKTILEKTNLVMEGMYEIIWSINPSKGDATDLIEKIKSYIIQTLEPLDVVIHFDIKAMGSEKKKRLTIEQRRQLFLIFKEAVNNIAKYALASEVTFTLERQKGHFIFTINDNGIGFDMDTIRPGNGLLNMKTRAQLIKGDLVIESKTGAGTCVRLKLYTKQVDVA